MQALQIVNSHAIDYFDAIVLDINMPIMDGFEACERMHLYFVDNQKQSLPKIVEPVRILCATIK